MRIVDDATDAVLIINEDKEGKSNYIGPNSFAEIAMAFFNNKKIFLLNDIYEPYMDELSAWGVVCLNGDLGKIKK